MSQILGSDGFYSFPWIKKWFYDKIKWEVEKIEKLKKRISAKKSLVGKRNFKKFKFDFRPQKPF